MLREGNEQQTTAWQGQIGFMYILVISRDAGCRRLCVHNLLIRGYLAVGMASIAESRQLVTSHAPGLILLCQPARIQESELRAIRECADLRSTPLLLLSYEKPDTRIVSHWRIASHFPLPDDLTRLPEAVKPWLASQRVSSMPAST